MQKRLECTIVGRVQLVTFRDFARRKARRLGVVGTVRNMPDGTVSVCAEGEDEVLHKFLIQLRKGPILSRVDDIKLSWKDATSEFKDFKIVYADGFWDRI
jgi:acylphosphatase